MAGKPNLESNLESALKALAKSSSLIAVMLVKRKLLRAETDNALKNSRRAVAILETLLPDKGD